MTVTFSIGTRPPGCQHWPVTVTAVGETGTIVRLIEVTRDDFTSDDIPEPNGRGPREYAILLLMRHLARQNGATTLAQAKAIIENGGEPWPV